MSPLFRTEFTPPPKHRRIGWVLLLAGALTLALCSESLRKQNEALNAVLADQRIAPLQAKRQGETTASAATSTDLATSLVGIERQLAHPWGQLLDESEAIRGDGLRVLSIEHDAVTGTSRLGIEAARPAQMAEVMTRLASASKDGTTWTTESVVTLGGAVQMRLARRRVPN